MKIQAKDHLKLNVYLFEHKMYCSHITSVLYILSNQKIYIFPSLSHW